MLRRVLLALTVLAAGLVPALVPVTASADRPARVTVRVSADRVVAGEPVRVTGRVRVPGRRATVVLQRRKSGAWTRVDRTRVRPGTTYTLRTRVPLGTHRLRVRVPRAGKQRALVSRVVRVRGVDPVPAPPATSELARVRSLVLEQTNQHRAAQGLTPLKVMDGLTGVAQRWSEQMAATGRFEHNPQFSQQYPSGWTRAGENIAWGYAPERVVQGWYDSEGHRRNMLGDYTHLGVGFARDAQGRPYYTQNFARY